MFLQICLFLDLLLNNLLAFNYICKVHMMGMFVEDVIAADMLLACVVVLSLLSVVSPLTDQKACFNKVTNTMKYSEWPCILRADASLHTSQIYQVAANICEREIPCTYLFYVRETCLHPLYICLRKEQFP